MHYARNALSIDPDLDTVEPLPAFSQFLNVLGQGDPILTPLDRLGMAAIYGAGPAMDSIVTNTQDSGPGSLRAAIYFGYDHPGTTITFNIPASDPGFSNNVFNIFPTDQLPGLWKATVIDGNTQPTNSNPNRTEILLNGSLATLPSVFAHGLHFRGTNCAARSLIIQKFNGYGVLIDGTNATGNVLSGCYVGIDSSGTIPMTNGLVSIAIEAGASGNLVGGTTVAARNIISGSSFQGMFIRGAGTKNNLVQGNYIGLNAAGNAPLPNGYSGVAIFDGAQSNVIGGILPAARNVISGNSFQGVAISDAGTSGNRVQGNFIGLNPSGLAAISNTWAGVEIFNGAAGNSVGGGTVGSGNVISGNGGQGVFVNGADTTNTFIQGNLIGVNPSGTGALSNRFAGVEIYNVARNTFIGGADGARNIISGNGGNGVQIGGPETASAFVQGNFIGVSANGEVAIPNNFSGVALFGGAHSNVIGGTLSTLRNVISGNANHGMTVGDSGTSGNLIQGNWIGLNAAGTAAISNTFSGVAIFGGAQANLVGGGMARAILFPAMGITALPSATPPRLLPRIWFKETRSA